MMVTTLRGSDILDHMFLWKPSIRVGEISLAKCFIHSILFALYLYSHRMLTILSTKRWGKVDQDKNASACM